MLRLRWALLNNQSCLMHRLHIVIIHPLVALGVPWIHEHLFFFGRTFLFVVTVQKKEEGRKEVRGGGISYRNRNRNIRKQHLFPNVSETRSRNTKEKPIAGILWSIVFIFSEVPAASREPFSEGTRIRANIFSEGTQISRQPFYRRTRLPKGTFFPKEPRFRGNIFSNGTFSLREPLRRGTLSLEGTFFPRDPRSRA